MSHALEPCPRCSAFIPPGSSRCVHCDAGRGPGLPRWLRIAAAVGGGGLLTMTLSACYGAPCVREDGSSCYDPIPPTAVPQCDNPAADLDEDGYCGEYDCSEEDPRVHMGAHDPVDDGLDLDCDGADD